MRILVYPHSMELGGSQMNAIELAAAVRDRGHEAIVFSEDGPLVAKVRDAGLEHIPRPAGRRSPSPQTVRDLRRLIRSCRIDIVHGYEWPPILEAAAATGLRPARSAAVGTVMSMAIAPFLPRAVPLVVGTAELRDYAMAQRDAASRRGIGAWAARASASVRLIEPPVDIRANAPGLGIAPPPDVPGLNPDAVRIVIVSRLVRELKLEGILTAIGAVAQLAADSCVQLVIVGDGSSMSEVSAAAAAANAARGRPVAVVAGESMDPRWAYGSADICIGMGGSALRAAAFGAPLVVQGEGGYFELLTDQSLPTFLSRGWYGLDELNAEQAIQRLVGILRPLVDDPGRRAALGRFGRDMVVDRFSLDAAAAVQEQIYLDAMAAPAVRGRRLVDAARSGAGVAQHKIRRRIERHRGTRAVDDFNARPAPSRAAT